MIQTDQHAIDRKAHEEIQAFLDLLRQSRTSKASIVLYVEEGRPTVVAIQNLQKNLGACNPG